MKPTVTFLLRLLFAPLLGLGLVACEPASPVKGKWLKAEHVGTLKFLNGTKRLRLVTTEYDLQPIRPLRSMTFQLHPRRAPRGSIAFDLEMQGGRFPFVVPESSLQTTPNGFALYAPLEDYRGRIGLKASYRIAQTGKTRTVVGERECKATGYCKKFLYIRGSLTETHTYANDCPGKEKVQMLEREQAAKLTLSFLSHGHRPVARLEAQEKVEPELEFLSTIPGEKCVVELDFTP